MKRYHNAKQIRYITVPIVFALVCILLWFAGIRTVAEKSVAEWQAVWIASSPEYTYRSKESAFDGRQEAEGATGNSVSEVHPMQGEQYGEIRCEAAELSAPLYYGDTEEILEKGAGTYTGLELPGEGGQSLIGAHDTTYFAPLAKLKQNDELTVLTTYGNYLYRVESCEVKDVTEVYPAEAENEEETLILYTCYPFGDTSETRSERYVVYAVRIAKEKGEK